MKDLRQKVLALHEVAGLETKKHLEAQYPEYFIKPIKLRVNSGYNLSENSVIIRGDQFADTHGIGDMEGIYVDAFVDIHIIDGEQPGTKIIFFSEKEKV